MTPDEGAFDLSAGERTFQGPGPARAPRGSAPCPEGMSPYPRIKATRLRRRLRRALTR